MSERRSGENHWAYGKSVPKNVKDKISKSLSGENHPLYGKHHSLETIEKMKLNNKHTKNFKYIYNITGPDDMKYQIEDLGEFCREHSLNRSGFTICFYQKTSPHHRYNGWQISRIKKSEIKS